MTTTHGGRRIAGPGKKLGRPARSAPKGKPIYIGDPAPDDPNDEEREMILKRTTPACRRKLLAQHDQLEAVSRLLRLLDGYISTQPDTLLAYDGGAMTWNELRSHIAFALTLPILADLRQPSS